MEDNRFAQDSAFAPEATTDEPASLSHPGAAQAAGLTEPVPAQAGELRFVEPLISDCLNETFTPEGRKPRHDGWTPERVGSFLRALAACGVVDNAADAAGLSASSAYAFRNRREGRAFARMWDAILIHRARARVAGENQSRAINGCVSVRKRDGVTLSEYHYYDNRLSMAVLTRLDRLADKEAASEAHLRALSEDMEEFIDCLEEGGDADAFVEARKPPEPGQADPAQAGPVSAFPPADGELAIFATLTGCERLLHTDPREIDVLDLDPTRKEEWDPEQWVRAFHSGFMTWLDICAKDDPGFTAGPGEPYCYAARRAGAAAAAKQDCADPANPLELQRQGRESEIDTADLDRAHMDDWTDDQWARASCSGFLARIPAEYWEDLASATAPDGAEE